jgi:hypothetical protein
MQGFLVYPFLPSYAQGCALLEKGRVLAWPRNGHASTLLCSGDPLVGREQILRCAQDDSLSMVILSAAKDL